MSDDQGSAVYAGIVGKLEEFDLKMETMTAYIERATLYLEANNVPREKWAATFLSALGKRTLQVLCNPILTNKVHSKSLDEVTKVLLNHYEPKPLVISERFNFNS